MSQSTYLVAVVTKAGDVVAWNRNGEQRVLTKGKKATDVAVCENSVFALTDSSDVMIATSDDPRLRGDKVLSGVAWIKPGSGALLCGLKDGTIVVDPATEGRVAGLKGMLQLVGKLPPEAIALDGVSRSYHLSTRLFWIEPLPAPPAVGGSKAP